MNIKTLISTIIAVSFLTSAPSYSAEPSSDTKAKQTQTQKKSVVSPRDAASGMPTGKRQHKPFSITKPVDKSSPLLSRSQGKPTGKAGYRLCPDGTRINPGEKCPEKSVRANYRLCPDGTRINPGEKCPEKSVRANYRLCPDGTRINPGEKCPVKNIRAGYRLCPDGTKINPGEKCPEKK